MTNSIKLTLLKEQGETSQIQKELQLLEINDARCIGIVDHEESQILKKSEIAHNCDKCSAEIVENCPNKVFTYKTQTCQRCGQRYYLCHIRFGAGLIRKTGSIVFASTYVTDKVANICQNVDKYQDPRDIIPNDPRVTEEESRYMEYFHMALIARAIKNADKPYHIPGSARPEIASYDKFPYLWFYWMKPKALQIRLTLNKTAQYVLFKHNVSKIRYYLCRIERGIGTNIYGGWITKAMKELGIDWFTTDDYEYYCICTLLIPVQPVQLASQIAEEIKTINNEQNVISFLDTGVFEPNPMNNNPFPPRFPYGNEPINFKYSYFGDSNPEILYSCEPKYIRYCWAIGGRG